MTDDDGVKFDLKANKPVFVGVLILIILLYGAVIIENGGVQKKAFAVCEPAGSFCENPFYNSSMCNKDKYKDAEVCALPFYSGVIGETPGLLYKLFGWICAGLIFLGFVVNFYWNKQQEAIKKYDE